MNSDPSLLRPGCLLLADPALNGSWFGRTAILITGHNPESGTQGFALNRLARVRTLKDLMDSPDFAPLADVAVYEGGPVSPGEMILMGLRWDGERKEVGVRAPLGIREAAKARGEGWEVRAFLGYTGWSTGQLENEVRQGSWIIVPPVPAALDFPGRDTRPLWSTLLRSSDNPRHALLAGIPEDPTLN